MRRGQVTPKAGSLAGYLGFSKLGSAAIGAPFTASSKTRLRTRTGRAWESPLTPSYLAAEEIDPDWEARTAQAGYLWNRVLIAGRYRGVVAQADEPDYPANLVELLSEVHLRQTLDLRDAIRSASRWYQQKLSDSTRNAPLAKCARSALLLGSRRPCLTVSATRSLQHALVSLDGLAAYEADWMPCCY